MKLQFLDFTIQVSTITPTKESYLDIWAKHSRTAPPFPCILSTCFSLYTSSWYPWSGTLEYNSFISVNPSSWNFLHCLKPNLCALQHHSFITVWVLSIRVFIQVSTACHCISCNQNGLHKLQSYQQIYLITISITTAKTVINKNVEGDSKRVPQSTWGGRSQQSSPCGGSNI